MWKLRITAIPSSIFNLMYNGWAIRQLDIHHTARFTRAEFDGVKGVVGDKQIPDEQVDGVRIKVALVVPEDLSAIVNRFFGDAPLFQLIPLQQANEFRSV